MPNGYVEIIKSKQIALLPNPIGWGSEALGVEPLTPSANVRLATLLTTPIIELYAGN